MANMTHALDNYNSTISIGGRKDTNLRFADDISITGEEDELTKLVQNLHTQRWAVWIIRYRSYKVWHGNRV